jgi:hypothetical protein
MLPLLLNDDKNRLGTKIYITQPCMLPWHSLSSNQMEAVVAADAVKK